MNTAPSALILDLVEWIATEPRTYEQVMQAWRTTCPQLPVWEDTVDSGYVALERAGNSGGIVKITAAGLSLLARERRTSQQ